MTPGMSSWVIVSHPGWLWVIFDPSGVDNSSVYTAVRPYPPSTLLYYISLLLGWWNIVQNGDPLYGEVNRNWVSGGHIWPNWVPFFAKKHLAHMSGWRKKLFRVLKFIFGPLGRHFFQTSVTFRDLRILVHSFLYKKQILYTRKKFFKICGLIR